MDVRTQEDILYVHFWLISPLLNQQSDMAKCMLGAPVYKIHPRLSPPFVRMGAGLDVFADFVRDKVIWHVFCLSPSLNKCITDSLLSI